MSVGGVESGGEASRGLQARLLQLVFHAPARFTHRALMKVLVDDFGLPRESARVIIREMVDRGDLVYTFRFGCSFLEKGYAGPQQVSPRIILAPERVRVRSGDNSVCIRMEPGGAFGTGSHPTTRMSLQAIDRWLCGVDPSEWKAGGVALDIGTGTGILAIAAAKLGRMRVLGLDVESISRKEARENVARNGLAGKVVIADLALDQLKTRYDLVVANLRLPSLLDLSAGIDRLAHRKAGVILSGMREGELPVARIRYASFGFEVVREETLGGWGCVTMVRKEEKSA